MNIKILIDLERLSSFDHSLIKRAVESVSKDISVIEGNSSRLRQIDGESINVLTGVVSAVASVIGLYLQLENSSRNSDIKENDIDIIIVKVETHLSIRLNTGAKTQLKKKLKEIKKTKQTIELTSESVTYKIEIHKKGNSIFIQGVN